MRQTFKNWDDLKVFKALDKIFIRPAANERPDKMPADIIVMDVANICLFVAKSARAKSVLSFYMADEDITKRRNFAPELDYLPGNEVAKTKYDANRLIDILNVLTIGSDDQPKFSMKKDFPVTIENEDWKVILAPMVEN